MKYEKLSSSISLNIVSLFLFSLIFFYWKSDEDYVRLDLSFNLFYL